ncbi:hypothetical protein [Lacihabitans soyangensis]|uniref:Uncharacterized protein n=1 Tax=Lacihabitans soyangensis TaxID=869394 RepID=A0AAE3KXJ6_9BACT|nr:hypothetical protein [Lacihabitans soyangensis]MCP9765160.1 hypothetical protein [Lacihabitans soyangensis]
MTLGFKTKTDDGKPTLFPEKVLLCLMSEVLIKIVDWNDIMKDSPYGQMAVGTYAPKLHSIREDIRWKPGVMIDFYTGVRTNNAYRFAPRVSVVSVQKIEIIPEPPKPHSLDHPRIYLKKIDKKTGKEALLCFSVRIDNRYQWENEIKKLAKNDGFDTVDEFFEWFGAGYKGRIIHWTSLKY